MKYLLDTNVCIVYLNGKSDKLRSKLQTASSKEMVLCSVVKAELLYGVAKSRQRQRNLQRLEYFLSGFKSLPFDDSASQVYAEIRAPLESKGTVIGPHDLLIASIAIAKKLTLVTHNTREFSRIPELSIEDWEE